MGNGRSRRLSGLDETLTAQRGHQLIGVVRIPEEHASPIRVITRRLAIALVVLFAAAVIVYLDRNGYRDVRNEPLTFLDCVYFSAVSLSTTGYGDITPYTETARLVHTLIFTALRIAFLAVLVGTTLEVLSERSRQGWKIQRWRSRVRNHTIVIGYGTKGKTAVAAILGDETVQAEVVVVDTDRSTLEHAESAGLVTVHGDATKADVLRLAGAQHAASIIVAASRDDTAVLVTLTARETRTQRQDRRLDPGDREPAPAAAVGRGLGGGVLGHRRAAPRAGHHHAQRRGDDRGSADSRRRAGHRRA